MARKQKQPAFYWYSESWIATNRWLSYEEKGKFCDLLSYQHLDGHLTTAQMKAIIGSKNDSSILWNKFVQDEEGKWYNEKLERVLQERQTYLQKQTENGKKGGRPKAKNNPTVNPNDNPNESPRIRNRTEHILDSIILEDTKSPKPQTIESNTQTQNLKKVDSPDLGQADRIGLASDYADLYES